VDAIDARTIAASGVPSSPTEHSPLKIGDDGVQQQKTEILKLKLFVNR
jgi:hypothetical protein